MIKKKIKNLWIIVIALIIPNDFTPDVHAQDAVPRKIASIDAPFDMPRLKRPKFPDQTFNIRDYGAKAKKGFINTEAIAKTIKACSEAGGGTVLIPAGEWLTGPIHLKSNINLRITKGAVVHFPSEPKTYLPVVPDRIKGVECYNYSPFIYAPNVENIAITGKGMLKAEGDWWWEWALKYERGAKQGEPRRIATKTTLSRRNYGKGAGAEGLRPSFIVPWKSKNILVEGITLKNVPLWAVRAVYSKNIIVRDISVLSVAGRHGIEAVSHNNAGVCLSSCKNALIEYPHIETTDDAIVVRSGYNEDGRKIGIPSENVVVRHFTAKHIGTGSGGIVFGSETAGGIRNVYVHDAYFEGADRGIRFKTERGRGNIVENIYIENIRMKSIDYEAITFNTYYTGPDVRGPAPLIRNIHIDSVECDGANTAIRMVGLPEKWLENLWFNDIKITNSKSGALLKRIKNAHFDNIILEASKGPAMTIFDGFQITLKNMNLQGEDEPLMIKGSETGAIDVDPSADNF
ncbi:MAG: glycoside hydrolase family 28 protein [Bacteroidales bacterium]|nr:glycoside hydrolase family 28 protein [Bacteroidales bacterium]